MYGDGLNSVDEKVMIATQAMGNESDSEKVLRASISGEDILEMCLLKQQGTEDYRVQRNNSVMEFQMLQWHS